MDVTLQQPTLAIQGRTAHGYSLVLPPGWRRIPLRGGTEWAIRSAVKQALAAAPRDAPVDRIGPYRLELDRRLAALARRARAAGGIDLYLPVGPVYDAPVAASFLVSELSLKPVTPSLVSSVLTSEDDTWQPVTADGSDGLRIERSVAASPAEEAAHASRCVDYMLPVPGRPGRWLTFAFSTLGAGNPDDHIAHLLTDLFDAIMLTFSWQREGR
jgi:hypothetical protein